METTQYFVIQARYTPRKWRNMSDLFDTKEAAEQALPERMKQLAVMAAKAGKEMPPVKVAEFISAAKPYYKEWMWLRDDISHYVNHHPPGTTYTEQELRATMTRRSWGSGDGLMPVTQETRDAAYRSMFNGTRPVLVIVNGQITRTAERPAYSD